MKPAASEMKLGSGRKISVGFYLRNCLSVDRSEGITEGNFKRLAVYFGLNGISFVFKCMFIGGDEVSAVLYAKVKFVKFKTYAYLPSYLEAVPGVYIVAHIVFA